MLFVGTIWEGYPSIIALSVTLSQNNSSIYYYSGVCWYYLGRVSSPEHKMVLADTLQNPIREGVVAHIQLDFVSRREEVQCHNVKAFEGDFVVRL